MTPHSLDSINWSEHLTELRETFYLADYQFSIKGCNCGVARQTRRRGHAVGDGVPSPLPSLGAPLSPNPHVFTNLEAP